METQNTTSYKNATKNGAVAKAEVLELSLKDYISGSPEEKQKFIDDLFFGLKDSGFIILKDHPIHENLLKDAYRLSEQLFDLDQSTKQSYVYGGGGGVRGYTPFGTEHAKDSPAPDLKEFWHVGRPLKTEHPLSRTYPPNIWPTQLPEFETVFTDFYNKLDDVGLIMLEALTGPLGLEKDYFTKLTKDGNSILRLLHYPPIAEGTDPNCVRAAAHEDINLITILVSASTSGLELLDRQGRWLAVETDRNNLIIDAGDMLARITNDVIPSTTHRVVNPQDGKNVSRYSMPYFMHPHPEALLTCIESCKGETGPKYPDILSEDFLMQRLREIGLIKDKD